jgi:single-strand DNA-binding protein
MPKSVNKWIGLGNVGKEPEMRSTGGGTVVANLSLACSDRRKDARGEWQDQTEWVNLTAFARTAEIIRDYVKKGSKLYVEGKLQTQSWEDKQGGGKKYKTVVIVDELVLLDGPQAQGKTARRDPIAEAEIQDSDIPF